MNILLLQMIRNDEGSMFLYIIVFFFKDFHPYPQKFFLRLYIVNALNKIDKFLDFEANFQNSLILP